jgi:hypothetical protein
MFYEIISNLCPYIAAVSAKCIQEQNNTISSDDPRNGRNGTSDVLCITSAKQLNAVCVIVSYVFCNWIRNNAVGIVTNLRAVNPRNSGSIPDRVKGIFINQSLKTGSEPHISYC